MSTMPKASWWNTTHCEFWLHFYSLPKNRKEIRLHLITLQKSIWCLGSHCHVRSQMQILYRGRLWAAGLWHIGLCPSFLAEQFVQEQMYKKVTRTQMYLHVFIMKNFLFMWNKWKIRSLETWAQFVSSSQQCNHLQYIKFLKLHSMKPSLHGWSKECKWSISVVFHHFCFVDYLVSAIEHWKFVISQVYFPYKSPGVLLKWSWSY
jgi:hypothetical protein